MKKILVIAAAAIVAIAACTKVNESYAPETGITFQVAAQLNQTKTNIDSTNTKGDTLVFPYDNFGVYSYQNDAAWLMQNAKVAKSAGVWKATDATYYWPKTGSLDFIGYYPQAATPWLTVAKDALTCTSYTISTAANEDLLYSTKAIGCTAANSSTGVPMIFHHALAQVGVVVKAGFLEAVNPDDDTDVTTWEIKIKKLYFKDMYKTGALSMSLASDNKNWTLPTGQLWTVSGSTANIDVITSDKTLTTTEDTVLLKKTVMPQDLKVSGSSKVMHVEYSIKTTTGGVSTTQNLTQDIKLYGTWSAEADKDAFSNKVDTWQMNRWVFYTLIINPLAKTPAESIITFDPEIVDWVYVDGGTYTL